MSDEGRGIEQLRRAIDAVALDIEARSSTAAPARRPGILRPALGVAAALIALLAVTWWIVPRRASEVEVLELRIRGRDVRASILHDTAPVTIIVIPRTETDRTVPPAGVVSGGAR